MVDLSPASIQALAAAIVDQQRQQADRQYEMGMSLEELGRKLKEEGRRKILATRRRKQ